MELTQTEFEVLLRNDLTTFIARTFAHFDPQTAYAHSWHIDLATDRPTQAVKGLVNRAGKGDAKAMQQMLGLSPLVGTEEPGPSTSLEAQDAGILADPIKRLDRALSGPNHE